MKIQNCISNTRLSPTKAASSGDSEQQAEEKVRNCEDLVFPRVWCLAPSRSGVGGDN